VKWWGGNIFFQTTAEKNLSLFYSIYILNFVIVTHNSLEGGADYLVAKHDVEIRRYLAWRKKVRGKTIPVRLYEIIYVGLVMLWSKMGKPPLNGAIHKYIDRTNYKKELMSGDLFQKLITEIKETPCEDKTGYYLANSRETLNQKELEQLNEEKESIVQELTTNNKVERYRVVFKFCELYQSWALTKKSIQAEDITKQENFETHPELPLKIIH
jgi:hypothetical protein